MINRRHFLKVAGAFALSVAATARGAMAAPKRKAGTVRAIMADGPFRGLMFVLGERAAFVEIKKNARPNQPPYRVREKDPFDIFHDFEAAEYVRTGRRDWRGRSIYEHSIRKIPAVLVGGPANGRELDTVARMVILPAMNPRLALGAHWANEGDRWPSTGAQFIGLVYKMTGEIRGDRWVYGFAESA